MEYFLAILFNISLFMRKKTFGKPFLSIEIPSEKKIGKVWGKFSSSKQIYCVSLSYPTTQLTDCGIKRICNCEFLTSVYDSQMLHSQITLIEPILSEKHFNFGSLNNRVNEQSASWYITSYTFRSVKCWLMKHLSRLECKRKRLKFQNSCKVNWFLVWHSNNDTYSISLSLSTHLIFFSLWMHVESLYHITTKCFKFASTENNLDLYLDMDCFNIRCQDISSHAISTPYISTRTIWTHRNFNLSQY